MQFDSRIIRLSVIVQVMVIFRDCEKVLIFVGLCHSS